MGAKSDRFRQRAKECERMADDARAPAVKQDFIALAANWRLMAAQIEREGLDRQRE